MDNNGRSIDAFFKPNGLVKLRELENGEEVMLSESEIVSRVGLVWNVDSEFKIGAGAFYTVDCILVRRNNGNLVLVAKKPHSSRGE